MLANTSITLFPNGCNPSAVHQKELPSPWRLQGRFRNTCSTKRLWDTTIGACVSLVFAFNIGMLPELQVQLIHIQLRVPEYGWKTQQVFHLMNFVVNGLRALQFGFYWSVFYNKSKVLDMILLDFPGLLFS